MNTRQAIPSTVVPVGALLTPGGDQGIPGAKGPTAVSADQGNISVIGSDGLIYTPGVKELELDLDLYVPLTNPSGTPETRFATIQAAHDFLLGYSIPSNRSATIYVAAGNYALSTPIELNHPQGGQISIVGAMPIATRVTAFSVQANTITCTVASNTGLSVGQLILLTGTNNWIDGGHSINSIAGTTVVLAKNQYNNTWTVGNTASATGNIWRFPSLLSCTAEGFICRSDIGQIANFSISGSGGQQGIVIGNHATIDDVLINNFDRGLSSLKGFRATLDLARIACFGCGNGIVADVASYISTRDSLWLTGNSENGFWVYAAMADLQASPNGVFVSCGNQQFGFRADVAQFLGLTNIIASYNNRGLSIHNQTLTLLSPGGYGEVYVGQNGLDMYATGSASILGTTMGGPIGSLNPANNTVGNQNAFISIST